MVPDSFAVLILSYKRAGNIKTLRSLERAGYSGNTYIVISSDDPQKEEYEKAYANLIIFDRADYVEITDSFTQNKNLIGITYPRNACFDIAKKLKLSHFVVLDDDYTGYAARFLNDPSSEKFRYQEVQAHKFTDFFDSVVNMFISFLDTTQTDCIAMAQSGDFIGGEFSSFAEAVTLKRKAMNSFFFKTDNPIYYLGKMNEDVNTYVRKGMTGTLFFTFTGVTLHQTTTQENAGGLTDLYLDAGTYVKSFYTVMTAPSAVKVAPMRSTHSRFHHEVRWNNAVPKIISDVYKK